MKTKIRPCVLCGAPTNRLQAWYDPKGKRTKTTYALCGAHEKGETTRVKVAAVLGEEA